MNQNIYLHAINLLPQFGPARLHRLWSFFKNWEKAYKSEAIELAHAGIEPENIEIFLTHRKGVNLEAEIQTMEKAGIKLLSAQDPDYPIQLLNIPKLPYLLYYKGRMDIPDEICVAVVGTRKISSYGQQMGPKLIQPLIDSGITIVSGLALGVDGQMQQLAVNSHRRTIAVLGGGLDDKSFYPQEHSLLANEILQNGGAIVSEHPINTPPLPQHFVMRNRIISGMSQATIIIESGFKGGSLLTAKAALEQGRTVFAVPGHIQNEMSKGTNNLIKHGAHPLTDPSDIFNSLRLKPSLKLKTDRIIKGDNLTENKILQQLSFEPMLINDIIRLTGLNAGDVTAALTFMEIKGYVKNLGAQQYIKSR